MPVTPHNCTDLDTCTDELNSIKSRVSYSNISQDFRHLLRSGHDEMSQNKQLLLLQAPRGCRASSRSPTYLEDAVWMLEYPKFRLQYSINHFAIEVSECISYIATNNPTPFHSLW